MKRALVCGGTGFIGAHLCNHLVEHGYYVRSLGRRKPPEGFKAQEHQFCDLRYLKPNDWLFDDIDEVYQLAGEVGGRGFIGDPANDALIMRNSTLINLAVLDACVAKGIKDIFYASSGCVYSSKRLEGKRCREEDALPADPDNAFAWEKLYAEHLYSAYARRYGLNVRIGRYFNCYGPGAAFDGGREKVIGALCRKVAMGGSVEVWGDGRQQRSFLYVEDACEATRLLMGTNYGSPVNICSPHAHSLRAVLSILEGLAGRFSVQFKPQAGSVGPVTIDGECRRLRGLLHWAPQTTLREGLKHTLAWVKQQLDKQPAIA